MIGVAFAINRALDLGERLVKALERIADALESVTAEDHFLDVRVANNSVIETYTDTFGSGRG